MLYRASEKWKGKKLQKISNLFFSSTRRHQIALCLITFDRNCEANLCLILKGLNFKIVALQ